MKRDYKEYLNLKKYWSYYLVLAYITIIVIYVFVRKEHIYMPVWDSLDSNIIYCHLLKQNKLFFGKGIIPMLGGLERQYFESAMKIYMIPYMLLPTCYAFVADYLIAVVLAVFGFIYLAKTLEWDIEKYRNVLVLCGFMLGIIPVHPTSYLGFASLPLFFANAINLYKTKRIRHIVFFFIYAIFSDLFTFGVFLTAYLFIYAIAVSVKDRQLQWKILVAGLLLGIGYVIVDWGLISSILFSGEESIRTAIEYKQSSFLDLIKDFGTYFSKSTSHYAACQTYFVFPICVLFFLVNNIRAFLKHIKLDKFEKTYNIFFGLAVIDAVIASLNESAQFKKIIGALLPFLDGFNFSRAIWINSFLWYLLFAMALCTLLNTKLKPVLVYAMAFIAIVVIALSSERCNVIRTNLELVKRNCIEKKDYKHLTFEEFYSEDLFETIKEDIDYDGEWSVAFGMHPAVIQYNNISTLDGYLAVMPKSYHQKFRKIIAPDLEVDEVNQKYFDDTGIRAYIFSKDVNYNSERDTYVDACEMLIDPKAFTEMGGKYVFSRVEITNSDELGFELLGVYQNEKSPYIIYVYSNTNFK